MPTVNQSGGLYMLDADLPQFPFHYVNYLLDSGPSVGLVSS